MFCNADGCNNLAKYLRIIAVNKDRRIKFNLCEECNKVKWTIKR